MYGKSDPNTFEWADGLFGNAVRQFTAPTSAADIEVWWLNNLFYFIFLNNYYFKAWECTNVAMGYFGW